MLRSHSRILASIAALCTAFVGTTLAAGTQMPAAISPVVVLSDPAPAYDEAMRALRENLQRLVPGLQPTTLDWRDLTALGRNQAVVTIGSQAAGAVARSGFRGPVLHTLIPRSAFADLDIGARGQVSAIFIDQPADRQIALIRRALPRWRKIALLSGPNSSELTRQLAATALEQRLLPTIETAGSDDGLYAALQKLLIEPAVLIATPDPSVFNSYTIQNILLTAYRQRSPVIGFSPAYVRAGAILAVYSTPRQIGTQAAEILSAQLSGSRLPPPESCRYFEVAANPHVARSLGIDLDDADRIRDSLADGEGAHQ